MRKKKQKLDYRKQIEGCVNICLKAFRSYYDQEGCQYSEKHPDRDFCKHYNHDGTCQLQDEQP
jgi:hypothetical protein